MLLSVECERLIRTIKEERSLDTLCPRFQLTQSVPGCMGRECCVSCVAQATLLHLNQSPDVVTEVVAEGPPAGCLRTLLVTAGDLSGKNAASTAAMLAQVQVRKNRISSG